MANWAASNQRFFREPSNEELAFVGRIFRVPHFQSLVREKERWSGKPVADPFVIAKASVLRGCVVTREIRKPNSSRIPNVCEHFGVDCSSLEGFMERESWIF